ncbi:MAG: Type 1 glutamine amidotransferase-like domain-containing protein [Nanoarchaeota archaeon]|nr:Type 1 glutamine amidotransferase-like domain-containing protein [Nanoarchaeota archaeon]MBU1030045.1 Type 1 glutamine amidotransferase-like domain-containing protein [Nanoarchaeota archaeon]MBU1850134.1 Type 1 glutamine amidotransferase-like domain-containing protein [Nanoarchaeota archaeon]
MKFYLSSFRLGNKSEELARLMPENKKIGYIPNACDFTKVDVNRRTAWEKFDIESLSNLGLNVEYLDLKNYFGKTDILREEITGLGGIFVSGGNTFILRQAMNLSGFDLIFNELLNRKDFVYSGYSAGICVLAPNLKALQIVDDSTDKPYKELQETILEGLGYLNYIILPHYKSDHPESADIDKEVQYCKDNNIQFKTLRDGDVIIIE